jgi:hypothetical protein
MSLCSEQDVLVDPASCLQHAVERGLAMEDGMTLCRDSVRGDMTFICYVMGTAAGVPADQVIEACRTQEALLRNVKRSRSSFVWGMRDSCVKEILLTRDAPGKADLQLAWNVCKEEGRLF